MSTFSITVWNLTNGPAAINREDALALYHCIEAALSDHKTVIVDFRKIAFAGAPFQKIAFGQLYNNYTSEQLTASLKISNLGLQDQRILQSVLNEAKQVKTR